MNLICYISQLFVYFPSTKRSLGVKRDFFHKQFNQPHSTFEC